MRELDNVLVCMVYACFVDFTAIRLQPHVGVLIIYPLHRRQKYKLAANMVPISGVQIYLFIDACNSQYVRMLARSHCVRKPLSTYQQLNWMCSVWKAETIRFKKFRELSTNVCSRLFLSEITPLPLLHWSKSTNVWVHSESTHFIFLLLKCIYMYAL